MDGDPSVIIRNGKILEDEMRRQRYNLDDLFQQLREQQIGSVREVTFAFLEPSGNLSVFTNEETQPVLALLAMESFKIDMLKLSGITEQQLIDELTKLALMILNMFFIVHMKRTNFNFN